MSAMSAITPEKIERLALFLHEKLHLGAPDLR
jgi:hypothetical protein